METNLSNISISKDGRVSFSGLNSGIDSAAAVDSIIAAKRIPVDRLETSIETNDAKVEALGQFKSQLNVLRESLSKLHGAVSLDRSGDVFEAKQAYASASRSDGTAASSPANILGINVTNRAAAGSHEIEVLQTARSHQVSSGAVTSRTGDLSTALGRPAGDVSGTITIGGRDIDVLPTDSLADLADRINAANSGSQATGVSATVVQAASNEFYLVLKVDQAGTSLGSDVGLADPDNVLRDLGVLDAGDGFASELQTARKAKLHVDGLLNNASWASAGVADANATLGQTGTLTFRNGAGAVVGSVDYDAADSLSTLQAKIAGNSDLAGAGIAASLETSGGATSLNIDGTGGFSIADSGGVSSSIALAREQLVVERNSNTVSDLFQGVTVTLFQAEPGTKITVDIDRDLTQVKTAVESFVTAYNDVRQFLNTQLDNDPTTGQAREDAVLFGSRTLSEVERQLGQILGAGASGTSNAFRVLAQIGVDFVNNSSVDDPTLADTLEIDNAKLDEALLNDPGKVRELLGFGFSSSDPRVVMLGFDGATKHKEGGYQLDIVWDQAAGTIASATVDGVEAKVNGRNITVEEGSAGGLKLYYNGGSDASGIRLDVTNGVASNMNFALKSILDEKSGSVQSEINNFKTQNDQARTRIDDMLVRIELQRESLTRRFLAMEEALASMSSLKESITQITDSLNADKN